MQMRVRCERRGALPTEKTTRGGLDTFSKAGRAAWIQFLFTKSGFSPQLEPVYPVNWTACYRQVSTNLHNTSGTVFQNKLRRAKMLNSTFIPFSSPFLEHIFYFLGYLYALQMDPTFTSDVGLLTLSSPLLVLRYIHACLFLDPYRSPDSARPGDCHTQSCPPATKAGRNQTIAI